MKMIKFLAHCIIAILMSAIMFTVSSCSDDDKSADNAGFGTVTGIVTDDVGVPLSDVTISVSGVGGVVEATATTNGNGSYIIENIAKKSQAVTFSKKGYQTIGVTINTEKFDANNTVTVNIDMQLAVTITGTVYDSNNGNAPLSGVTVKTGAISDITDNDGKYTLEGLGINDYEVTFERAGYLTAKRNISRADFVNGEAILDVRMGGVEVLRDKTVADLQFADKWYYNEYRGGRNNFGGGAHWDWSCSYMCTLDFWGFWEEQNEGTSLRTRNNKEKGEQENPADLEMFDSYVHGSKLITNDNKILSLSVRTHNASESSPTYFGVQVIDLSASDPKAVLIGDIETYASSDYKEFHFDLSAYVDKEVIVAIGIFRKETGDYNKQLVMRRIAFNDTELKGISWFPGTEVIDGWKLTREMVRSTMPMGKKVFTGKNPMNGNRDNYLDAYRKWREIDHVAATWSLVAVNKDVDPFRQYGYAIKTRANEPANTLVPQSFYYAKFSIAAGNNQMTFKTRNEGSNYTFFKVTAIENDGTITFVSPKSNTAREAGAADDGCWKFKHTQGDYDNPDKYASFVYDLSAFNGKDVVIAISVHNGETNGDENRLALFNIEMN